MKIIDWNKEFKSGVDYVYIGLGQIKLILQQLTFTSFENKVFIDLGCGTGQFTREMYHKGFNTYGIDGSQEALRIAEGQTVYDIHYVHADLDKDFSAVISVKGDLVSCKYTYAFLNDKENFLDNVVHLLADKGVFVIISPLKRVVPKEKEHITLNADTTKKELEKFFSSVEYSEDGFDEYYICRKS